jgi:thioredoxin reductase
MASAPESVEVCIVGGGPAGASAALVLGRCGRKVVVYDSGRYRNAVAPAVHAFLTREGTPPDELRRLAREELARYPTVEVRPVEVEGAERDGDGFVVSAADGSQLRCRKVLLATGLLDELPDVEGAAALYGKRLFHCPYCDAWELRDQPLAVYSRNAEYAYRLAQWTRDVVVCTDGEVEWDPGDLRRFAARSIAVDDRSVSRFERDGEGVRIEFDAGAPLWRRAVFFHLGCVTHSGLARRLGCEIDEKGGVRVNKYEATCVPGVYVAGDASRDVLLAIVAAGEGAAAAVAINSALDEDALKALSRA